MKFTRYTTRRIAVFRALQLGDMLCCVPALRALRAAYPDAEITLLGLPWAKTFCARFSGYLDQFIHFPGYEGLPEQQVDTEHWRKFEHRMREQPFDLILQMQGTGSIVNAMLENLGAGPVAGFKQADDVRDEEAFLTYPTGISEIERHLRLLEHLGVPSQGTDLEFPISEEEEKNLYIQHPLVRDGHYVCVHPGSRGAWRQWPPSHFASLADHCAAMGFQVFVTGTKDEANITRQVIGLMNYPAIDLTGQTGLGEIGQLLKKADLLISNCTGVSHIASALATPSIVISMDGEPERWGPLNKQLHYTFDWTKRQDFAEILSATQKLLGNKAIAPQRTDILNGLP